MNNKTRTWYGMVLGLACLGMALAIMLLTGCTQEGPANSSTQQQGSPSDHETMVQVIAMMVQLNRESQSFICTRFREDPDYVWEDSPWFNDEGRTYRGFVTGVEGFCDHNGY